MTFDFDQVFDRHNTGSTKWSRYPADVLPMWVADMDFAAPPVVIEALQQRLLHPLVGYSVAQDNLREAIVADLDTRLDALGKAPRAATPPIPAPR